MNGKFKRLLSLLLAVVMVLGMMPVTNARAETSTTTTDAVKVQVLNNGTEVTLADCEYTYDETNESFKHDGYYFTPGSTPNSGSAVAITVHPLDNGTVRLKNSTHYLHFYSTPTNPGWDKCSNDVTTSHENGTDCVYLFEKTNAAGVDTVFPGYRQVTSVADEGRYLIAGKHDNGNWYVLHPGDGYIAQVFVKEVLLTVDGTQTITVSGDYSSANIDALDETVATVDVSGSTAYESSALGVDSIESGKRYVIYNWRAKYNKDGSSNHAPIMTNVPKTKTNQTKPGLALVYENSADVTYEQTAWTITHVSGELYTIQDCNGKYLTLTDGTDDTATLVEGTACNLKMVYNTDTTIPDGGYWVIGTGSTCLNAHGGTSNARAASYYASDAWTDGGSRWVIYEYPDPIVSGEQYVIFSNTASKNLTKDSVSVGAEAGSGSGLALDGNTSSIATAAVWTIESTEAGAYYVKDADGKYLTVSANNAEVTETPTAVNIALNGYNWTISKDGAYLNDFGNAHTGAAGWQSTEAATGAGSQWKLYRITDSESTTTITFTGVGAGTSNVKIGDMTYVVHIHGAEDDNDCTTAVVCPCGHEITAAAAHTPGNDDNDCTTAVECTTCGSVTTPAEADHIPDADDNNCTTAVTCTNCSTVTTPAAAAHTWGEGSVTKNPTVDEVGVMTYKCTVDGCNGTKTEDISKLEPVAMIGEQGYATIEDAIAAAAGDPSLTRIEILCDYVQTSVENIEDYYYIEQNLTIGASENVTVSGCGFAICVNEGGSLTIEENVTIEGLDVVANGFATTGDNLIINGDIKALSLKQWTSNGTITVNETGSVWLGYGDGQFDMAYGNGTVTVNGNGDKTNAQFKAGYSGTRGNGNTLNLTNTYFEGGARFTVEGSNGTFNVNNSILKVSGGDYAGYLTVNESGNTFNLTNGAKLEVATLTLGAGNALNIDGTSQVVVTTLSGAGTITIDAAELTAGAQPIKGDASGFTGSIQIANNDALEWKLDENNNIVLVNKPVAKIGDVCYYTLAEALAAAQNGDTITLLLDVTLTEGLTIPEGKEVVLDLNGKTVSYSTDTAGVAMITNQGELTLTGEGNVAYTYTGAVDDGKAANAICNEGKLIIDGPSVSNTTTADGQIGYAVDNYAGGELTVESGSVTASGSCYYDAIRMFCNSDTENNVVVINGGTVGTVWMQNPSDGTSHNTKDTLKGSLTITGGTVGMVYLEPCAAFEASITGGTIEGVKAYDTDNSVSTAVPSNVITGGIFSSDVSDFTAEDLNGSDYVALPDLNGNYVVGAKPTATVNDLGMMTIAAGGYNVYNGSLTEGTEPMPLSFVMQFLADQTEDDMANSPYADWYGDFVITFTGIENDSFTADGCYLAGHYGSFGWIKVPVDGMTIEEGVRYPVMLGVGMGQNYEYICSGVQDFKCALYLTPEILEANPNLQVKLELALVDDSKGDTAAAEALMNNENVYSVTNYKYDAEDFVLEDSEYVAQNGNTSYASLAQALAAAKSGETVTLLTDTEESLVLVPAGVIFDLNGHVVEAANVLSFGVVMDSAENVGGIEISNDTTKAFTKLQPENGGYLPIYDTRDGMYKFFAYELVNFGKKFDDASVTFAFGIKLTNVEGYEVLANTTDSEITLHVNFNWPGLATGSGFTHIAWRVSDATIRDYAEQIYAAKSFEAVVIMVSLSGVENLSTGDEITAAPVLDTTAEVYAENESIVYTKP